MKHREGCALGSQEGGQMSFALGPTDVEQVLREEPLPQSGDTAQPGPGAAVWSTLWLGNGVQRAQHWEGGLAWALCVTGMWQPLSLSIYALYMDEWMDWICPSLQESIRVGLSLPDLSTPRGTQAFWVLLPWIWTKANHFICAGIKEVDWSETGVWEGVLRHHQCVTRNSASSIFQMQYVFIYQALLEHYLYGDTELEVTSLETHLQKIYNKIPGTSNNGLEEEFKVSWSWTVSFRMKDLCDLWNTECLTPFEFTNKW